MGNHADDLETSLVASVAGSMVEGRGLHPKDRCTSIGGKCEVSKLKIRLPKAGGSIQ
ncbi:hypothetical protein BDR07DRAFT_1434032 [Suillus spraguei]|nr:hypothetical protein BDR07DRAFT_1434032 [Suillus spraguei]